MILDYFSVYFGTFFSVFGGPGGFRGHLGPKPEFYQNLVKFGAPLGSVLDAKMRLKILLYVKKKIRGPPGGSGSGFQRVLNIHFNIEGSWHRFLVDFWWV